MSKKLLGTLIASLFAAAPALAQSDDPFRVTGSVTAGGIYTDTSGGKNPLRLQEYQDLDSGFLSNIGVRGRNSQAWVDAYGENFGRDDQYAFLRGGMYDMFKYGVYSNSMPHNVIFNARTPYAGVGSNSLVATFPQPNPGTWNQYDLGTQRVDNGGMFEWQKSSPWYFRADGNQVKFTGTNMGAAANGTSPGNGFVDLAFPQEFTTNNVGAEGGYQTKTTTFALRYDYSKFENSNETLNWSNPFWGSLTDTTHLAPSNEFNKFTATGNLRGLPANSVVAARYTWAKTTSSTDLATRALNGTGANAYAPTNPNIGTFNGEYIDQSFQLSWTARPMSGLDTRVYYYWTDMSNNSSQVEYRPGSGLQCMSGPCDNELFSYNKNNFGIDVWWRFAKGQRLGAGYDYLDLDQHRHDYGSMKWNKFWVEYKNTSLDNLSGRLKYTYVDRTSDYLLSNSGVNANDPQYLLRFTTAYDMQDATIQQLKLVLDWSPAPLFDLAFEGIWSESDYNNVSLGRTEAKRQEYYVSAAYGAPGSWRVNGFADYEKVKYPSNHRFIGGGTCPTGSPNCFDPATPPTSNAYNWNSATEDENWAFGVGLDLPVNPKFMVKASYIYFKTEGSATFESQNNYGNPLPITNFDNTERQSLNLKGIYAFDKTWSLTGGYAYEKYKYDDIGTNGYQYTVPFPGVTTNASQSYLSGYNAFQNYTANIFYLLLTYKF